MQILSERAYWILDYYRIYEIRLAFGARISGEEAVSEAMVMHVWRETEAIGIKLFDVAMSRTWDRLVSLAHAAFFLAQMGDPEFESFKNANFHSVLIMKFLDCTTMFLAETSAVDV